MEESTEPSAPPAPATRLAVQNAAKRPCDACGTPVDPLRAPFVAHLEGAFRYYCSPACYAGRHDVAPLPSHAYRVEPAPDAIPPGRDAVAPDAAALVTSYVPERPSVEQTALMLGLERASLPDDVRTSVPARTTPGPSVLSRQGPLASLPPSAPVLAALGCAAIAALFSQAFVPPGVRTVVSALAVLLAGALSIHELRAARHVHPALGFALAPAVVGPATLVLAAVFGLPGATASSDRLAAAAILAATLPLSAWAARRSLAAAREALAAPARELPRMARVLRGTEPETLEARLVRAGEEIRVTAGEDMPVDGVVREGEARVVMHPGGEPRTCVEGDSVLAGAHVIEGTLRVLGTRSGDDVALARLPRLAQSTAGVTTRAARAGDIVSWALPAVAVAMGIVAAMFRPADGLDPLVAVACALAAGPAALCAVSARVPGLHAVARAVARGVVFRDLASLDAAERVGTVVLCVRGTVTLGRLELVDVVSLGARTERDLVALAAAAEDVARDHPIARAVAAVAAARGARLESVRRPALNAGRGITAVSAAGESVAIGSRQLLLAEGVSAAPAEDVARAIEGQGRTAVFVAVAGRVEGVLGFEDPLRDEARPAVQALMDAGFDLALLSGESSGTVEAIGLALDIANVRAEVAPDERAAAVRAIAEVAGAVAVVGNPRRDGASLAAADVAISLAAAGGAGGESAIALASDDLRSAARALSLARSVHRRSLRNVALAAAVALVATGLVAVFPSIGPLGALALCAGCVGADLALSSESAD